MVKVRVIEEFTLKDFQKLQNIERASRDEKGRLFANDKFECDEKMFDYLTGNNKLGKKVVEVIEIIPEKLPTNQTGEEVTQYEEPVETITAELKLVEKPKKKKTSKKQGE